MEKVAAVQVSHPVAYFVVFHADTAADVVFRHFRQLVLVDFLLDALCLALVLFKLPVLFSPLHLLNPPHFTFINIIVLVTLMAVQMMLISWPKKKNSLREHALLLDLRSWDSDVSSLIGEIEGVSVSVVLGSLRS